MKTRLDRSQFGSHQPGCDSQRSAIASMLMPRAQNAGDQRTDEATNECCK
jgi:hypothetical protein